MAEQTDWNYSDWLSGLTKTVVETVNAKNTIEAALDGGEKVSQQQQTVVAKTSQMWIYGLVAVGVVLWLRK